MNTPLYSTLLKIRDQLQRSRMQFVLAESCTAGMVAAELGQIPGISEFFCGSMVVYQSNTKVAWLDVDPDGLADPKRGPVSPWASEALARQVLAHTPHATVAAAITGHLGPNAPRASDGTVFYSFIHRNAAPVSSISVRLQSPAPLDAYDLSARRIRQSEAAHRFLEWFAMKL